MAASYLDAARRRAADAQRSKRPRLWLVSDVHAEYQDNIEWLRALGADPTHGEDALILAGDVSADMEIMREVLATLVAGFGAVFFTPGNHDLWTRARRPSAANGPQQSSLDRLREIFELCQTLGVHTRPAHAAGALVVPIHGWYHASWDTEPDVVGWSIPKHTQIMRDFFMCHWPPPLTPHDESVAKHLDSFNDTLSVGGETLLQSVRRLQAAHPDAPLVTFSHFVPRIELNPEKRYLFFPPLAKAIGSRFVRERIQQLRPTLHCFGHTHFGWDATLDDGVRYIQAPLSYPEERRGRLGSVATGETFPHAHPPTALLIFDGTFPPRYDAGWSNFYSRYPRRADLNHIIAPYVAAQGYERTPGGRGDVGWFGKATDPYGQPLPTPLPAWQLGPKSAVEFERAQRAADQEGYLRGGGESTPGRPRPKSVTDVRQSCGTSPSACGTPNGTTRFVSARTPRPPPPSTPPPRTPPPRNPLRVGVGYEPAPSAAAPRSPDGSEL